MLHQKQTVHHVGPQTKSQVQSNPSHIFTNLLSGKFLPQYLNLFRLQLLEQRTDLTKLNGIKKSN